MIRVSQIAVGDGGGGGWVGEGDRLPPPYYDFLKIKPYQN